MNEQPALHIAYADDHVMVRNGIVAILNSMGGLRVTIEANDGAELIERITQADQLPDVCILDINMPGMNGFETIVELKKRWPALGVLILTAFNNEYYFIRMIMSGANGYLLKSCDPEDLKTALIAVHNKGIYYPDEIARNYFQMIQNKHFKFPELSPMQMEVLKYCCTDLSYAEIAEKMGTTTRSVQGYRDVIFKELNVNSRVSLALFAVQFGIVPIDINTSDNTNFFNHQNK